MKILRVLHLMVFLAFSARAENLGRTLFIGDSLSMDEFGQTMVSELHRLSSGYSFYAGCGSKPGSWVRQKRPYVTNCGYWYRNERGSEYKVEWSRFYPKPVPLPFLDDMLKAASFDTLIVQLGLNMLDTENLSQAFSEEYVKTNLKSFVRALNSDESRVPKRCFWISPNRTSLWNSATQERLYQALISELKGTCQVIDGRIFTQNASLAGDGYHLHGRDARRFAVDVMAYIQGL